MKVFGALLCIVGMLLFAVFTPISLGMLGVFSALFGLMILVMEEK